MKRELDTADRKIVELLQEEMLRNTSNWEKSADRTEKRFG